MLPLVEQLSPSPDVMSALWTFADTPDVMLLDSALRRGRLGRYSFLTADPFEFFRIDRPEYGRDPFADVRSRLERFHAERVEGLPPFQGGAAGLLSYELGGCFERVPTAAYDEFQLPALAVGLYDWVIAWDHAETAAWIISHGFPETDPSRRRRRAAERLRAVKEQLARNAERAATAPNTRSVRGSRPRASSIARRRVGRSASKRMAPSSQPPVFPSGQTRPADAQRSSTFAPQFPAPGLPGLTSDFSRDGYLRTVERVIEYIRAGDIFQANLSQRLLYPQRVSPLQLYERLQSRNPAPMAGYFAHGDWAVLSASPERFIRLKNGEAETRPIKGTRRRQSVPEADLFTRDELRESGKDQAENLMIVDLLRNDLSRVCRPGSIRVPHLSMVETYETVQHLVSEIRGRLDVGRDLWDLFRAVFPGGSITGAPKVRAMEIIAELEPTARGPYCGSLFYAGFDGTADSSILIRTFTCRGGWVQCPVGGGIVAQSDPRAEYEETLHKAEGMLRALEG